MRPWMAPQNPNAIDCVLAGCGHGFRWHLLTPLAPCDVVGAPTTSSGAVRQVCDSGLFPERVSAFPSSGKSPESHT